MHLFVIAAFAVLFWRVDADAQWRLVSRDDITGTLGFVIGGAILLALTAMAASIRARRLLRRGDENTQRAVEFHHRATFALRIFMTVHFVAAVLLTPWADWLDRPGESAWLRIFSDLAVLSPFVVNCVVLWLIAFPLERRLREGDAFATPSASPHWRLASYLDFNIRHHLLVVAAPMTLILFASNVTRAYDKPLRLLTRLPWASDLALGLIAAVVFLVAPVMLRRIWRTSPLPPGPLRERLERMCERINLRCRDILVWKSDGIMINAAVMGVAAPVRYVLLSDALLATMTPDQVEAVFGHEAGHVRLRHIQHFLVFAFVGWTVVAGLMELLAASSVENGGAWRISFLTVETAGIVATIAFWTLGFGWVSRRFERQADLYGARCVTPESLACDRPCSVHLDPPVSPPHDGRICATAAGVFASALHRVAMLNGIPPEERSWRHSSIASRVRFLASLAGDPALAQRFERSILRIKTVLLATALVGVVAMAWYGWNVPQPALLKLQAGLP